MNAVTTNMFELTADNAETYLRSRNWIGAGRVCVEALSGGVSNVVLRVETSTARFVLKQSRPQLRTRAAWFSDLDRIYREQEVMQALASPPARGRSRLDPWPAANGWRSIISCCASRNRWDRMRRLRSGSLFLQRTRCALNDKRDQACRLAHPETEERANSPSP